MIPPGLVLLCPNRLSRFCSYPPYEVKVECTVLQSSGTVVPPPTNMMLLCCPAVTRE